MRRTVRELRRRLCLPFPSRSSSSSVGSVGGSQAAGARPQQAAPPPSTQQTAAPPYQQQLLQQPSSLGLLGDPVSVPRGTLLLSSAALLMGGVALGAAVDRLASRTDALHAAGQVGPGQAACSPSGAAAAAAAAALPWRERLHELLHLPPFLSRSHAQAHGGAAAPAAAPEPHGGAGAGVGVPLGGCLSPYFISDAAAKAAPAVVNIMVQAGGGLAVGSSGSGFVVDPDGTILTNAHVVAEAIQRHYYSGGADGGSSGSSHSSSSSGGGGGGGGDAARGITVTLQDGRVFDGRLVSFDTVSDLAVVKVDSDAPLPAARLGRSASLRVGEWVVALGSPLHLQNSVTAGIISCVDRKAVELGLAGARTGDFIQTDAAINKGNSGGPLVNLYGEVVGISAMKAVAADGVSFAIPVDTAVDVMRQLRAHGRVMRPYVGIKMLQLTKHNAASFRRRDAAFPAVNAGILVPGVHAGSPAERAGLRAGDVIVGFGDRGGEATTAALIKALGEHIGKPLALRVARPGGAVETLTVVALEAGDPAR